MFSVSRIDHREGGILSAKREYLRVRRKELIFDICARPLDPAAFSFPGGWVNCQAACWRRFQA